MIAYEYSTRAMAQVIALLSTNMLIPLLFYRYKMMPLSCLPIILYVKMSIRFKKRFSADDFQFEGKNKEYMENTFN